MSTFKQYLKEYSPDDNARLRIRQQNPSVRQEFAKTSAAPKPRTSAAAKPRTPVRPKPGMVRSSNELPRNLKPLTELSAELVARAQQARQRQVDALKGDIKPEWSPERRAGAEQAADVGQAQADRFAAYSRSGGAIPAEGPGSSTFARPGLGSSRGGGQEAYRKLAGHQQQDSGGGYGDRQTFGGDVPKERFSGKPMKSGWIKPGISSVTTDVNIGAGFRGPSTQHGRGPQAGGTWRGVRSAPARVTGTGGHREPQAQDMGSSEFRHDVIGSTGTPGGKTAPFAKPGQRMAGTGERFGGSVGRQLKRARRYENKQISEFMGKDPSPESEERLRRAKESAASHTAAAKAAGTWGKGSPGMPVGGPRAEPNPSWLGDAIRKSREGARDRSEASWKAFRQSRPSDHKPFGLVRANNETPRNLRPISEDDRMPPPSQQVGSTTWHKHGAGGRDRQEDDDHGGRGGGRPRGADLRTGLGKGSPGGPEIMALVGQPAKKKPVVKKKK